VAHVAAGTNYNSADGSPQGIIVLGFAITTLSLPDAMYGRTYAPFQLLAGGMGVGTYPWITTLKWVKGSAVAPAVALPKGMKLTSSGVLWGTPSKTLLPGRYIVSVSCTETVITINARGHQVKTKTTVNASIPININ